jgi:hypothetical protein
MNTSLPAVRRLVPSLLLAFVTIACTPDAMPTHPMISSTGPRPSSPAIVDIIVPAPSTTVHGETLHVVLRLLGATLVPQTTTDVRPDEGHLHLYVNNVLVSMNYGLEQDIPVQPGSTVLRAEFVAADHAPFSPRVWSSEVVFTVTQ